MLSKDLLLKKPSQFFKIKKYGKSLHFDDFTLRYTPSEEGFKVGIVVSKKVSLISPKRNRLKRIFKAIFKDLGFKENFYIAVYPKISSLSKKYSQLKVEIYEAIKELKV